MRTIVGRREQEIGEVPHLKKDALREKKAFPDIMRNVSEMSALAAKRDAMTLQLQEQSASLYAKIASDPQTAKGKVATYLKETTGKTVNFENMTVGELFVLILLFGVLKVRGVQTEVRYRQIMDFNNKSISETEIQRVLETFSQKGTKIHILIKDEPIGTVKLKLPKKL